MLLLLCHLLLYVFCVLLVRVLLSSPNAVKMSHLSAAPVKMTHLWAGGLNHYLLACANFGK